MLRTTRSFHSNQQRRLVRAAFDDPFFSIAWVVFLAFAVRRLWWVRDAALVCWIFGYQAYQSGRVLVLPGKPTRFSTGDLVPGFPDAVTGFVLFFAVVFGFTLLLFLGLSIFEKLRPRGGSRVDSRAT